MKDDNVIHVDFGDDETVTGEAVCMSCEHIWRATAPIQSRKQLKCPKCLSMTGHFAFPFIPDIPVIECGCGNTLMFVTQFGPFCPKCANSWTFDELP